MISGQQADFLTSRLWQLVALLALAVLLGGGGVAYGIRNLVIQLASLAILALNPAAIPQFYREAPRVLTVLVAASVLLPLLHLLPLPPQLWQGLPGRDAVAESFAIAGLGQDRWFSLSVDPARSLVAFCGTLAPAVIIIVGSTLSREDKRLLAFAGVALAFAAFLLGAVQFASGNTFALLYDERPQAGVLYATFANRNSTALLFVMGLCLLSVLPASRNRTVPIIMVVIGALLAIGVVLTQSRSGIVLLAVPLGLLSLRLLFLLLARKGAGDGRPGMATGVAIAAAVLLAGALGASYVSGGRVATSVERFSAGGLADRTEMWEDSFYTAGQYWPLGSGMGTFDEVFQLHESLEYVSPRKAGRAHSDWLEIAIEGGLPTLLLAFGWLAWCLFASLPRGSRSGIWLRLGAGGALGCVILQSLLDYPLRNQALLCIAALCVVLLVRPRSKPA